MSDREFSRIVTEGEKHARDTACMPVTQPLWYLWLPFRWLFSKCIGFFFGSRAEQAFWRTLTLANLITSARFLLLANAIMMFADNAPLAEQIKILFIAIITDVFDGAAARNNNEITALGTYMDHIGDWSVITWVIFLSTQHITVIPFPYLAAGFLILPILLAINVAKFKSFYDPESSLRANIREFAIEELQTDFWGRIQFNALSIAIFGALFLVADVSPLFFAEWLPFVKPLPHQFQVMGVHAALAVYLIICGKSIGDALDYSEARAKNFREKLRKMKAGSR